ncbi:hypothetical protein KDK95_22550 [Actinospica sp. MGRD01-02]|uniref:Uncharacterized protein n=1 Tax=Actinospica acidithermotolerans TaxID=2828514 RepID=A0A941EEN8_9ACTN|nr:DUF6271 family protein [Actinospica acidithermotolerans]MBR7829105.1 hypothetical protein [Actinospica acidithermotolerans]
MRRICLALPTNRACPEAIAGLYDEAAYAAREFGVEVHMVVLDSSAPPVRARHRATVDGLPPTPNVVVSLLDEDAQRAFLTEAIAISGLADGDRLLDLMLPRGVSYGAVTNRIFLIAAALGCESVHRRDSDSRYQSLGGEPMFPIHHEAGALGRVAGDLADSVSESTLDRDQAGRTVAIAGASFVGELSVDISEIEQLDPEVYREVVSLWAPSDWTEEQKRELVDESFRGAGTEPFVSDHATLGLVDPMRIDMCNIAFHRGAYERVPVLPALDTIGSDYFLMHAVHSAGLPGVLHNRHIVNYYTPERRTDEGFAAYQLRFAKFFLSMLYLNDIYERMDEAGSSLLDEGGRLRSETIAAMARDSTLLDTSENRWRLDVIGRGYRKLGGRYARFTETLTERGDGLLEQARTDIEEFAMLVEAWQPLVEASRKAAGALRVQHGDRGSTSWN